LKDKHNIYTQHNFGEYVEAKIDKFVIKKKDYRIFFKSNKIRVQGITQRI
jgi:hypothetical protein